MSLYLYFSIWVSHGNTPEVFHVPKLNLYTRAPTPHFPVSSARGGRHSTSCVVSLTTLDTSCKWRHIIICPSVRGCFTRH